MKRIALIKGDKESKKTCLSDFSLDVPGEIMRTFDHSKSHSNKGQGDSVLNARIASVKAHIVVP